MRESDTVQRNECLFLSQTEVRLSVRKCIPLFQNIKKNIHYGLTDEPLYFSMLYNNLTSINSWAFLWAY